MKKEVRLNIERIKRSLLNQPLKNILDVLNYKEITSDREYLRFQFMMLFIARNS